MPFPNFLSLAGLFRRKPTPTLTLTHWEQQIFTFLRRAARSAGSNPPIELRVAGGWVRDKLLNRSTGDIDIAIHHASGSQFAEIVQQYAQKHEERKKCSFIGPHEFIPKHCATTCIEPNPQNSRHLETAAVLLDGHSLDFVQLRTEDYTHSRVPTSISPASPYEDAMRRDFTINSLFYNIHTFQVEDWTNYGLSDLKNTLLRTPLDASITLKEDPLRALRAIRFACKLNFKMNGSLRNALADPNLHHILIQKVSRERIGLEIFQIIQSQRVIEGFQVILDYNLVQAVFGDSFNNSNFGTQTQFRQVIDSVKRAFSIWTEVASSFSDVECERYENIYRDVLILSLLVRESNYVRPIISKSLRGSKQLERDIRIVITSGKDIAKILSQSDKHKASDCCEMDDNTWVNIAKILRQAGEQLHIPILLYCSVYTHQHELCKQLMQLGLNRHVCLVQPVLDGHALVSRLGLKKGPLVGHAHRELIRLQMLQLRWHWKLNLDTNPYYLVVQKKNPSTMQWILAIESRLTVKSENLKKVM